MTDAHPTTEKRVTPAAPWVKAWQDFNDAARRLGELAKQDGDELKIDIKYKPRSNPA